MNSALSIALGDCTDLPPGKIASIVTYLEMRSRPSPRAGASFPGLALLRLTGRDMGRYLSIYRTLGERWLWWSRLELSPASLALLLDDRAIEAFSLTHDGEDVGLLELDFRRHPAAELAFFGLVEPMIGTGTGRWLMERAIERAWHRKPSRFLVHTCTFDHPGALEFYRRSGFAPYRFAIEFADDPRLRGVLPRSAGPHVPLLTPAAP
ncbi:MAG: GNAT family N-acetyltransferase [Methylobacteriaceae bacterium]|nr:GNAT family N-acetyltransferase [Methylobacteriaceae bacterium]MBV9704827.1 GNAT family N-acetyltransferase [Methylobacteriaceae bacterium]